jgi:hypothetical protein
LTNSSQHNFFVVDWFFNKNDFMKRVLLSLFAIVTFIFTACDKAEDYTNLEYEVLKQWELNLFGANVNPTTNRTDTGHFTLQLTTDQRLQYQYKVDLFSGDSIIGLTLHTGDVFSSGPAVLDFKPKGSVGFGTGAAWNVRQSLLDSLMNPNNQYYLSLNSVRQPNGALRAQLNQDIVLSANVSLSGANEVPPVTTTATGVASLRVTSNKILYSRITVTNLEPTDALSMAHIHTGAVGTNGPVLVPLATSAADFGVTKTITLTDAQYTAIVSATNPLYVNVHTTLYPAGKIRGQLK